MHSTASGHQITAQVMRSEAPMARDRYRAELPGHHALVAQYRELVQESTDQPGSPAPGRHNNDLNTEVACTETGSLDIMNRSQLECLATRLLSGNVSIDEDQRLVAKRSEQTEPDHVRDAREWMDFLTKAESALHYMVAKQWRFLETNKRASLTRCTYTEISNHCGWSHKTTRTYMKRFTLILPNGDPIPASLLVQAHANGRLKTVIRKMYLLTGHGAARLTRRLNRLGVQVSQRQVGLQLKAVKQELRLELLDMAPEEANQGA